MTPTAQDVRSGNRRALARAITLAESTRRDHREQAEALLQEALPATGHAVRAGISGTPGVGKSSFIDVFGTMLTGAGHQVAVLAVDPTSALSGGSILGDKTRMERLARDSSAFVRPSPSGGTLGGVARRTREAMLLCEAAGHDVVLVETVGVGQSEIAVADMVDVFVLLLAPAGGDELQGIKRGIVELADVIVVNKADGALKPIANYAAAEYRNAIMYLRPRSPNWTPEVLLASAHEETGIGDLWDAIGRHRRAAEVSGEFERRRAEQARHWLWAEVRDQLADLVRDDRRLGDELRSVEADIVAGRILPGVAARRLLAAAGLG